MTTKRSELLELKKLKLKALEQEALRRASLPHLHAYPMYQWQRDFWESRNTINLVVGCNQVGKSLISIRKCIHWATAQDLWPSLWKETPRLFFYFYPDWSTVGREVSDKWEGLLLPREALKDHPVYGWQIVTKNGFPKRIKFNSGVTIEFMTYSMSVKDMQASSPHAIFADEEMPEHLFSEVIARLMATAGYFHQIFTATMGQEFWREALEGNGFPDAFKRQFSLYDCLKYEDGAPSWIKLEDVKKREALFTNEWQKQIRIHGRFAVAEGLLFDAFDRYLNVKEAEAVPADWRYYVGVDVGSGGSNHPAAICFVAVSPDNKQGRVVRCWRGDRNTVTTAPSVLQKYVAMKAEMKVEPVAVFYDWASKDFETFAIADGIPVIKAEKSHDIGIPLMNGLFKNERLHIDDIDENYDLIRELLSIRIGQSKKHRADDAADSLRYAITKVPWDLTGLTGTKPDVPKPKKPRFVPGDRSTYLDENEEFNGDADGEFSFWSDHLNG